MKEVIITALGVAGLAALRKGIKSYRAHKAAKDILVDALEAGLNAVDKP